jgi:flagellar motor protein MotB
MTKFTRFTLTIITFSLITYSCKTTKPSSPVVQTIETIIEKDAQPPVGYKPNYISNVDLFRVDDAINYQIKVINTEVRNGKVRVYFNITDDKGKAYVRANQDKWDKVWCQFQEKYGNEVLTIKNYQLFGTTERDSIPNAFAMVLDHSGSMGDMRVLTVQNAVSNMFTSGVQSEDAFAAIKYDNKVVVEMPLTKDENLLMSQFKVNGITEYGGTTAINDGIDKAIEILDAANSFTNKAVIVYTDGMDNASKISQSEVIAKAKEQNIKIFAIDFGANTDNKYMPEIAKQTGGCYYHIYSTNEFNSVFTDIYKRMKNVYIFEYTPSFFGQLEFKLAICNNKSKIEMVDSIGYEPVKGNFISININFDSGKSNVKSQYSSEIERLAKIIKKDPKHKFEIQGHTDDVGDAKSNLSISQKRAEAVKNELVKKGIEKSRLSAKGFGESAPKADNKTKEGKIINRRIELVVMD